MRICDMMQSRGWVAAARELSEQMLVCPAGKDKAVKYWDADKFEQVRTLSGFIDHLSRLFFFGLRTDSTTSPLGCIGSEHLAI